MRDAMLVEVNGTQLYVERRGRGTPLLFLHGSTLDHRMWRPQVEALAPRHDVVTYDLRGHGRSALPTGPYAGYEDAAALIEHLGLARAVVVGHSVGALYALELAAARPELVAGLALIDMSGLGDPPFPADLRTLVGDLRTAALDRGVEAAREIWVASSLFATARERPSVRAELDPILAAYSGWAWVNASPAFNLVPPVVERLASITAPTVVVVGDRDHAYNLGTAEVLAARMPNATLVRVPGAGHMASMEAPEIVTSAIARLL